MIFAGFTDGISLSPAFCTARSIILVNSAAEFVFPIAGLSASFSE
jgi:hypothetical protein